MFNFNNYFAEVIESSLNFWQAQTWQWDNFPKFGSLLTSTSNNIKSFGIVYNIYTGSSDNNRIAIAYKKNESELKIEQPQIFHFLKTTFSCINLGFCENDKILYQFTPEPLKIHSFVSYASTSDLIDFFSNEQYLHLIFANANHIKFVDELLLAILKMLSDNQVLNYNNFVKFIDTFSVLTANDYRRLKLFLQRAERVITINK